MSYFTKYVSNTTAGTSNNFILEWDQNRKITFRTYFKLLEYGKNTYNFYFSNAVDSTFDDGSVAWANRYGGKWKILSMRAGSSDGLPGADDVIEKMTDVKFSGNLTKEVEPDEKFYSDDTELEIAENYYLVIEMTVEGNLIPATPDSIVPNYKLDNDGRFGKTDEAVPHPNFIGIARKDNQPRVAFLGDSITQGCATANDGYEFWASKIGKYLHKTRGASVWNLGLGFGKAYDAATDSAWLSRVKQNDVVFVCFGVNDIFNKRTADQIWSDLLKIDKILLKSGCKVVQLTIPPFNMEGKDQVVWREVNRRIREFFPTIVEYEQNVGYMLQNCQGNPDLLRKYGDICGKLGGKSGKMPEIVIFDIAAPISEAPPIDHRAKYGPHPDGNGGTAICNAFIEEFGGCGFFGEIL